MEHETEPHETEPREARRPEGGSATGPDAAVPAPASQAAGPALVPVPAAAGGPGPGTGTGTGEPRVDAALRLLDRLPGLPVSEHPELFEQVHAQLTDVLGELDSGPAAGPPAG
jgi:hypothetical protein